MLYKINKQQFIKDLETRKFENLDVVRQIEKTLIKQRGYIFKMPKRGSSVILLLSGGLDSVACWGILMKEFGLHVYPLFLDKGEERTKKEKKSIDFFSKFYQKRFPLLYHLPLRLYPGIQNITIPMERFLQSLHSTTILQNFTGSETLKGGIKTSLGSFLLLSPYAKLYAEYLYNTQNCYVRTIFCSFTRDDGLVVPQQTFTSLRTTMYYLCETSGDFSWQFASPVFEKETGLFFDKSDLVKWAFDQEIPLEKTWTCYHSKKYQCGSDCITCINRKDAFYRAGIFDKTTYRSIKDQNFVGMFKYKINKVLNKIQSLTELLLDK